MKNSVLFGFTTPPRATSFPRKRESRTIDSCVRGRDKILCSLLRGCLLLATTLMYCGCASKSSESEETHATPIVPVTAATVQTRTMQDVIDVTGKTDVLHKEKIFSPVAGRLISLKGVEGTVFAEGDVMATILPREAQSALIGAEAMLRDATTEVQKTEARRALTLAQQSQSSIRLTSRFAGTVATRNATEGELVSENTELFTLIDLRSLVFYANVPLSDVARIKKADAAIVRFAGQPRKFSAVVDQVLPEADEQNQTAKVRLHFAPLSAADGALLRLDMNGSAQIIVGVHQRAVSIPRSALLWDDEHNSYSVMVAGADSLAHYTPVSVGILTDSTAEIMHHTLQPGMRVLIDGHHGLADSTRISFSGTVPE